MYRPEIISGYKFSISTNRSTNPGYKFSISTNNIVPNCRIYFYKVLQFVISNDERYIFFLFSNIAFSSTSTKLKYIK